MSNIQSEYLKIINREMTLINPPQRDYRVTDANLFLNVSYQINEVARNSTVLRCCGKIGHLGPSDVTPESDGAHTNLVWALVEHALDFVYGWDAPSLHYSRRVFSEAVRMHDLPENYTGDLPDNESTDRSRKSRFEQEYYEGYLSLSGTPRSDVLSLLAEMETKSSLAGRVVYLADKLAAILMVLEYDRQGLCPFAFPYDLHISNNNRRAMEICDYSEPGYPLLSEIWSIDFLQQRELTKYDDTGFFTALLVMSTLKCHENHWYHWREIQYQP